MPMDPAPAPPEPSQSSGTSLVQTASELDPATADIEKSSSRRPQRALKACFEAVYGRTRGWGHHKTTRKSTSRDGLFRKPNQATAKQATEVSARTDSDLVGGVLDGFPHSREVGH